MADEAFVHARWHRALDDPGREPPGPIRDHILAARAAAVREALEHTHTALHFCPETREWWIDDLEYDGHHAKRGRCPVLVRLASDG